MSEACFTAADILLPAAGVPLDPWACIAVDQFTSQPEYWQRAEQRAENKPSTLHIVLPEAYLGTPQEDARLQSIRRTMEDYRHTVLTRKVHGYVYVERTQMDGTIRQGLVGAVDLEAYDYTSGAKPAIRPSEKAYSFSGSCLSYRTCTKEPTCEVMGTCMRFPDCTSLPSTS